MSAWQCWSLPPLALAALGTVALACGGPEAPADPGFCAVPVGDSPRRGPEAAPVTLVRFVDFECPYCAASLPTLAALDAARPGVVRHVFKHLPLDIHPHAAAAAIAAECAHAQGRFWEMHDALFAGASLDEAGLTAAAEAADLDLAAYAACRMDDAPRDRIVADLEAAVAAGVTMTPTLFANGRPLAGAHPLADLLDTVDRAAADAEASGLEPAAYYDELVARPCR